MKNYYYNIGDHIFALDATGDFPQVEHIRSGINIDYSYRIEEDGILRVRDKDNNITEHEVKKNDIVFVMYSNTDDYRDKQIIIIHDDRFSEYFTKLDERDEKRMKEMSEPCSRISECTDCCEARC